MSFLGLILRNVVARKARALLAGLAIAVSIMTVVAMGVLTHSLEQTATNILRTGKADFTVAQRGLSDIFYSAIDEAELARLGSHPEVQRLIGVLLAAEKLDEDHPLFLLIGVEPDQLEPFGVQILRGRPFDRAASDQIMLGFRAARDLRKDIGDSIAIREFTYRITGIYTTGEVFGDSGAMLPLTQAQAMQRKPGNVSLAFVQVRPGTDVDALRRAIEADQPQLATVRTESEFGHVDRNLALIRAANAGVSIMALVIGGIIVMNTMMLTVFERTREFGILRAVGWSRLRVIGDVLGEALVVALAGAAVGIGLGFGAIRLLEEVPDLVGIFRPHYVGDVFVRALAIATGMALIGGLYPAVRAALLMPLEALRHE
jgi:putative ABC transport system permease protein